MRAGAAVAFRPSLTSSLVHRECLQVGLVRVDPVARPSAGLAEYADPFQHLGSLLDARQIELHPTLPVAVGALGDRIALGNDRFLVNGVRKRSFSLTVGFVRNCAQYFLRVFVRLPNRLHFARRHSSSAA